jgi:hypothetical protein
MSIFLLLLCFGVLWVYYHTMEIRRVIKPLHAELNPICHLLPLLGAHHILHVSRIRVGSTNVGLS